MTSKENETDHRQNPIQAKASASGSVAPSSPYRGTGYRSVSAYLILIRRASNKKPSFGFICMLFAIFPSTHFQLPFAQVAFGTWAVGDASRRFAERKRGRSSGGGQCEKRQVKKREWARLY